MRAPPFRLSVGAQLLIHGRTQLISDVADDGDIHLKCVNSGRTYRTSMAELASMRLRGEVECPNDGATHQPSGRPSLKPMTDAMRARIARRIAYVRIAVREYPVGPKSSRLQNCINLVALRNGDSRPPSPHSVYRWVRRYVESNYDTAVFLQDAAAVRTRTPRIDTRVQDCLRTEIERLLGGNVGATLNGVMNEALATVAKNLGYVTFRTKEGVELLPDEFLTEQSRRKSAKE